MVGLQEEVKKCSENMGLSSLEQTGKVELSSSLEVSKERRTGGDFFSLYVHRMDGQAGGLRPSNKS